MVDAHQLFFVSAVAKIRGFISKFLSTPTLFPTMLSRPSVMFPKRSSPPSILRHFQKIVLAARFRAKLGTWHRFPLAGLSNQYASPCPLRAFQNPFMAKRRFVRTNGRLPIQIGIQTQSGSRVDLRTPPTRERVRWFSCERGALNRKDQRPVV